MTIPDGCPIDYMHCILQGIVAYMYTTSAPKSYLFGFMSKTIYIYIYESVMVAMPGFNVNGVLKK
jgi:hypothetical protein